MPLLLYVLEWLFNTTASFLFGVVFVPLVAFTVSPWLGAAVIVLLVAAIPIARRILPPGTWRREYGWCLLMPGVGLLMRRRLLREDRGAAALAWRLACCGGLAIGILSGMIWNLSVSRFTAEFQRAAHSDAEATRWMEGHFGRQPLEVLRANRLYRELPTEQRQRMDEAWQGEQERWWRRRFQADPAIMHIDLARSTYGYDRLVPRDKAAFDRAWNQLYPPAGNR